MQSYPFLKRVALAKILGLLIGAIGYLMLIAAAPQSGMLLLGIAGWFATLGALVGILSFYQLVPFIGIAIPVWIRGGWCGAWMGLLLVLVAHGEIAALTAEIAWVPSSFSSPWWLVLEMAFWGAIIDVIVTAAFGSTPWEASGLSRRADLK